MVKNSVNKGNTKNLKSNDDDFRKMVENQSPMLYTHIRSMLLNHDDTDDVLQNTFIKAWQNMDGFRHEAAISSWLFRIATNEALQHLRRQKLKNWFLGSQKINSEPMTEEIGLSDGDAIKKKLEKAMHTLSVQQRMVFGMKYFNDMKYTEMAEVLNLSVGTLKAVYHKAVKKIEKYIISNA
ncbi:MAG TPA: sigma-70 family RNA polymerase sigma factor [Bacteroidales bacterium]|nr:sigma-70 family RNA polymerase sigma factor [Bacteroidales bacterium]